MALSELETTAAGNDAMRANTTRLTEAEKLSRAGDYLCLLCVRHCE